MPKFLLPHSSKKRPPSILQKTNWDVVINLDQCIAISPLIIGIKPRFMANYSDILYKGVKERMDENTDLDFLCKGTKKMTSKTKTVSVTLFQFINYFFLTKSHIIAQELA